MFTYSQVKYHYCHCHFAYSAARVKKKIIPWSFFLSFSFLKKKRGKNSKNRVLLSSSYKRVLLLEKVLQGFFKLDKLRERGFSGSWAREVWVEGN
jgi:hypothetical protein